jgi:hypothetical protein
VLVSNTVWTSCRANDRRNGLASMRLDGAFLLPLWLWAFTLFRKQ